MNTHKNARLTFARRLEMVQLMLSGLTPCAAAAVQGVSPPTARKWLGRYLRDGLEALRDASSRPRRSPKAISENMAVAIIELRRRRLIQRRIAQALNVSVSTVSRVLARAGISKLSSLDPVEPIRRYEHVAPGEMIHIDTKKLGKIVRPGHRVTGNRRDSVEGAGWECLFVAIDDHARIGFSDMYPDERTDSAIQFLENTVRYFGSLGVKVNRLLTDNGSAFRSKPFAKACRRLGVRHSFTRPYRPQTNGKAERFIQSALREWAYAFTYGNSQQRTATLDSWIHHYNWHRPHMGIGGLTPMTRLQQSRNNLLTLHS